MIFDENEKWVVDGFASKGLTVHFRRRADWQSEIYDLRWKDCIQSVKNDNYSESISKMRKSPVKIA